LPLSAVGGTLRRAGTGHAAEQEPRPGTGPSTLMAADGGTGKGANHSTERGTAHTGID
jgi:hypothetical protein